MVYPSSTMQSDGASGLSLEAQLASKEREWKELQALRVHQLENSLTKAQEECSSLREQYQQLKEDFQFNLIILEERDRELERYDVITSRALTVEQNRQEELSQLRTQVAKVEEQRAREAEERQEELRKSRDSAAQHRLQLDQLKWKYMCALKPSDRQQSYSSLSSCYITQHTSHRSSVASPGFFSFITSVNKCHCHLKPELV